MNHTIFRNLLAMVLLAAVFTLIVSGCTRPRKDYEPEQPFGFSHYLHAGQHEIACQYCHTSPAMGRHSSVPSLDICMNCHSMVSTDKPKIQELRKAYDEGRKIEWTKVHDLPDFVYFDHQPHVAAFRTQEGNDKPGSIQGVCAQCHGQVNTMEKVSTQNEFNMGWCVNCHRENFAPINCTTCHR